MRESPPPARALPEPRYLALCFPWLSADRLRATRAHLFACADEGPVGFTDPKRGQLLAVDRAGAAAGLSPGMAVATARAIAPGLRVFRHEPAADLDWLERLADACTRWGSTVALDPADGLALALAGGQDERLLATDVEARFARRGVAVGHAFGDTPAVARALARHAGGPAPDEHKAVRRLPLAALELDDAEAAALTAAGLRTVGDVMGRPAAAIAARFGAATAAAVCALDGRAAPLAPHRPAPALSAERFPPAPLGRGEGVLDTFGELAAELATVMAKQESGARRWTARLFRADGVLHDVRVDAAAPTRDPAALLRPLRARVSALSFELGGGCDLVRLDIDTVEPIGAARLQLDGGAAAAPMRRQRRAGAVDRGPVQADLRLPLPDRGAAPPPIGCRSDRPIHLFDPPERLEAVAGERPDGTPARFRWRRRMHEIAHAAGPETREGDRRYYRVEDRRGRRFWLFRVGPPDGISRWFIHGLFA